MSRNKILDFNHYTVLHTLSAFNNTNDAVNAEFDLISTSPGDFIQSSAGNTGIVIINEFSDREYVIVSHENTFSFNSPFDKNCTSSHGVITITDGVGGLFQDFLRTIATKMKLSQTHLIFSLRMYIIGIKSDKTEEIIPIKPLIFHMFNLSQTFASKGNMNLYSILYVSDYNTYGLLPNFTKMYQMTVTHRDSSSGIATPVKDVINVNSLTTKIENSTNVQNRKLKLDKTKTMHTLHDLLGGLETELKAQVIEDSPILQKWLGVINSDNIDKEIPNTQKSLPIDYNIVLDDIYKNYIIDNRNLPNEQPSQSQVRGGINSYPINPGATITGQIKEIMLMSRTIGKIATQSNAMTFKINVATVKITEPKYIFNITINNYVIPNNSSTIDTGPGDHKLNPLEFSFQRTSSDLDIKGMWIKLSSDFSLGVSNTSNNVAGSKVIFGNREQITLTRSPDKQFFKNGYTGIRTMADPKYYGLEYGNDATKVDNLLKTNLTQTSIADIEIIGNPQLLSDIFRNPIAVSNGKVDNATYYKFPEKYPMYVKLDIYLNTSPPLGHEKIDIPAKYYYNGYYHLGEIKSIFVDGEFSQMLRLYRTDDVT